MTKKVYVGNLSFGATEDQVRDLFSEFGDIQSIAMINDRAVSYTHLDVYKRQVQDPVQVNARGVVGNPLPPS